MISARDQAERLASLLAREHACMADFLGALAEFDRAKGWEDLGYANLFVFLTQRLKLSKSAAFHRLVAARLVAQFPETLQPLRDGRLCMSSAGEVAKVLSRDNVAALLPRFFHLSRREAAELVAETQPSPRIPDRDVIRSLPLPSAPPQVTESSDADHDTDVAVRLAKPIEGQPAVERVPLPSVVPLDAGLRRLHITVSKRLLAKVELARDALSHSHPGASMDTILEAGLDLVIERHRKRRGIGAKARPPADDETTSDPRRAAPGRITADAKRRVWERDGGRCQWPIDGGGTCGSTLRLEFDHRVPRGLGGGSDASNLRLLCRFHNQHAAREVYGDETMDRFAGKVPRASEPVAEWRCHESPRRRTQPRCRAPPPAEAA